MKKKVFLQIRTIVVVICLIFFNDLLAQNNSTGFYINPKVGIYNMFHLSGKINSLEAGTIKNNRIYSASYSIGQGILNPQWFHSLDFMYGSYFGNDLLRFEYQGGLGMIMGVPWDSPDDKGSYITAGIPLKTGLKIIPLKFLSIGIDLQVNLNLKFPIYMPMISIEIGNIRQTICHGITNAWLNRNRLTANY